MKYIIGNQKNYLDKTSAYEFSLKFKNIIDNKIIICPSYTYFPYFDGLNNIGAQNIELYDGVHTGDINASRLSEFNFGYCIVGHSERRIKSLENNTLINKKIVELLKYNIRPILCIGETFDEKEKNITEVVLKNQLTECLKTLSTESVNKIIFAYEPVWAISDGIHPNIIPTNEEIYNNIEYIKKFLFENFNIEPTVLYGGSVNSSNIDSLNKIPNIDGYLIGSASKNFIELAKIIEKCK